MQLISTGDDTNKSGHPGNLAIWKLMKTQPTESNFEDLHLILIVAVLLTLNTTNTYQHQP